MVSSSQASLTIISPSAVAALPINADDACNKLCEAKFEYGPCTMESVCEDGSCTGLFWRNSVGALALYEIPGYTEPPGGMCSVSCAEAVEFEERRIDDTDGEREDSPNIDSASSPGYIGSGLLNALPPLDEDAACRQFCQLKTNLPCSEAYCRINGDCAHVFHFNDVAEVVVLYDPSLLEDGGRLSAVSCLEAVHAFAVQN